MKKAYPVIVEKTEKGYIAYFPDFDTGTQGEDIPQVMEMSRDAISMLGLTLEDEGKPAPEPSDYDSIEVKTGQFKTLVDVDFDDYRKKHETKAVKKNCTIPSWLCYEAEKAGINFSATLKEALKAKLGITEDR